MEDSFGPMSAIGTLILGIAVLWAVRLAYGSRGKSVDDILRLILTIGGWTLINVGIISVFGQMFFIVSAPFNVVSLAMLMFAMAISLIPVFAIFAMVVNQFRRLEWTSLMWTLSAAASRGIPLTEAADAFAAERTDEIGLRSKRLGDLLSAGIPLPDALSRSHTTLPFEGILAARYGCEIGDLGLAIGSLVRSDDRIRYLLRSTLEKCFYLGLVLWVVLMVLSFMQLRIMPMFQKMFAEFGVDLPTISTWVMVDSPASYSLSFFFLFATLGLACGLVLFIIYYVGWLPADIPLLNRLGLRFDGAMIMRSLMTAVKREQPLANEIWILSRVYPKRSIRKRLVRAGNMINNGESWPASLYRAGIIRASESAVLASAERAGNLEWALDEMADSSMRRLSYRMRVWISVLFPAVLLTLGALIALIVIGLFLPTVTLIEGLL